MTAINDADTLYLGTEVVDRVYAGNVLVWEPPVSAFAPDDLAGLVIWLDASQLGLADGAAVNPWPNRANAAKPGVMVPAASGTEAALRANALNGKPAVRFYANHKRLRITGTGVAKDYTLAYVARMWGTTPGRILCAAYPSGGNTLFGWWTTYQDIAYATGGGGFFTPDTRTAWTTNWKLYSGDCATPSVQPRLFSDGVLLGSHPSPPAADGFGDTLNLSGYSPAGAEETSDCEVAEVVMYNRKLSDVERQQVEAYLRVKWGL
jgi:hypothetical protein